MSRIFITGSADGLGKMAAQILVKEGHSVVLHARNETRAKEALAAVPKAETVVTGDLASIAESIHVAEQINKLGAFDAVIHNAAVGYQEARRVTTADGLPHVFAINSLSPYILTCIINKPKRLVYTSSGLHKDGDATLRDLEWNVRNWNGYMAYADSKLHNVILAFYAARKWPGIFSNAMEPGWVATKMGGPGAPDSLEDAPKTQVWLAAGSEPEVFVSGKYFYHKKIRSVHPAGADPAVQDRFIAECERLSGIKFPV